MTVNGAIVGTRTAGPLAPLLLGGFLMAAKKTAAKKVPTKAPKAASKKAGPSKSLKAGDPVEWNSPGGKAVGKVVKKVTGTTKVKAHVAKASPANPEYLVKSDKSGKQAVHKPGELRKKGK